MRFVSLKYLKQSQYIQTVISVKYKQKENNHKTGTQRYKNKHMYSTTNTDVYIIKKENKNTLCYNLTIY